MSPCVIATRPSSPWEEVQGHCVRTCGMVDIVAIFGKTAWHVGLYAALKKGPCLKYCAQVLSRQPHMGHSATVTISAAVSEWTQLRVMCCVLAQPKTRSPDLAPGSLLDRRASQRTKTTFLSIRTKGAQDRKWCRAL